ncbi:hypothetical protein N1M2_68 [Klebsiella phage N1M2]|uniref:Uncharacterized protein n=1 Tax=Klebsiella phage N1M2 TaxID=2664939 RepID=A0A6B7ZFF1_9CAUD|nr:hypothetical protein PQB72_gp068 [Klebsiella phage N1M2]QGH71931.1 hypothetical protein N1M2_68 [Klebsiella phage N1M2]
MIKYGYIAEQESMSSHLRYNTNTRDYFHPWAAKVIGHTFGAREYSKFIPFKDYLEMPVDFIEDFIEGLAEGEQAVVKAKLEAAKREASKQGGVGDPHQAAIALAQKSNKG